jgi:hypothetical protein
VGKRDGTSFLPLFVFGALELFVNHTITQSMSLWFIGLAGISALGAIGTVHMVWRAREESENEEPLVLTAQRLFPTGTGARRSHTLVPVECQSRIWKTNS